MGRLVEVRRLVLLLALTGSACTSHGPSSGQCEQVAAHLRGYEETFSTEVTKSHDPARLGLERTYHVGIEGQGCHLTVQLDKLGEEGEFWDEDRIQSGRAPMLIDVGHGHAIAELNLARKDGSRRLDVEVTVVPGSPGDAVVDVDTNWRPSVLARLTGYDYRRVP